MRFFALCLLRYRDLLKAHLVFGVGLAAVVSPALAAGGQISQVYSFAIPEVETVRIGAESYRRLRLNEAPNGGLIGHPALPGFGAQILLPPGSRVEKIEVRTTGRVWLGRGVYVEPVAQPAPLSAGLTGMLEPEPNPAIYRSDELVPKELFENTGVHGFRGYSILVLKLHPVQYLPSSGDLFYHPSLEVVVTTSKSPGATDHIRGLAADEAGVKAKVDNPSILTDRAALSASNDGAYDLLILTTPALVSAFQPLADYHNATGVATVVHTTAEIGITQPETIRDYLRLRYLADGIEYVLIGGDDDLIPAADLYVQAWETGSTVTNLPGDIYYACLDGTYNYDGDGYWGEPGDGDLGGDVDLIADVYVGRAPVGNATEATRFVNKTISYLNASEDFLGNVLLAGGQIGFGGDAEWGGNSLDELVDSSLTFGRRTIGIPSDQFSIHRLYDRDRVWTGEEAIAYINSGCHIVDHYSHSNVDYALKTSSRDLPGLLSNTDFCFLYSQGCLAGHFDDMDCWAEYMNVRTDHGAFALVMNAREGWGTFLTTDGPSQRYNREFWDAVYSPMEGKPELGRAHHDSKEDNLYRINEACMRWCYYETTLFGDPTVAIKTVRTLAFDYSVSMPLVVAPGEPFELEVTVRGVGVGVPAEGTALAHISLDDEPFAPEAMTTVGPNRYLVSLPALACGQRLVLFVSAEEQGGDRIYETSPDHAHLVLPGGGPVTVFEDDFETDQGWQADSAWGRGAPLGAGGNNFSGPDPGSARSGEGIIGYNLSGNYSPNMDSTFLTSPVIDCSGITGVHLTFWRRLGLETPPYDHASFAVSINGYDWTTVWDCQSETWDANWNLVDVDLSPWADQQESVQVRFVIGPTDGGVEYCGWNIDDLAITGHECPANEDYDNDGIVNSADNCPTDSNPDQTDADTDSFGTACDCDDSDPTSFAGATEVPDDGIDQNCDGVDAVTCFQDWDADGFGTVISLVALDGACNANQHESEVDTDCDDASPGTYPGAPEIPRDSIDQDCDGFDLCCLERVGDANGQGEYPDEVTLGDIMLLVDALYVTGDCSKLGCLIEADVNQDGGGNPACDEHITLGDIMMLVDFLFITGPESAHLNDCM
jgi:hypothetical protein